MRTRRNKTLPIDQRRFCETASKETPWFGVEEQALTHMSSTSLSRVVTEEMNRLSDGLRDLKG